MHVGCIELVDAYSITVHTDDPRIIGNSLGDRADLGARLVIACMIATLLI